MGEEKNGLEHRFNYRGVDTEYCVKCGIDRFQPKADRLWGYQCPTLLMEIPFIPPTSNHCYTTIWSRRMRVLTKEAQAFKTRVLTEIVPNYLPEISRLDKKGIYSVQYRMFFDKDEVMTKTFGQKKGAESQYKEMDLENRLKLLSDVVSKAIGIDDSQFFAGMQEKYSCEVVGGVPQVHIFLRKRTLSEFGF